VIATLVLIGGMAALPAVAVWVWQLHVRVVEILAPGADFFDVATLADRPAWQTLGASPCRITGPTVRLVTLIREAASVLVAYLPVGPEAVAVADSDLSTVVLDLDGCNRGEMAILERWRAAGTHLVVGTDLVAGQVAIQQQRTLLTVTLPLVA